MSACAAAAEPYHLVVGDWRDERYAVHGPAGRIACGVPDVAARALVEELNRLAPVWEAVRFGRVYISGPMTGIADLNAPAFAAEAARLLALGYQVENPADVVLPDGATWADYMRADIPLLLACSHIRMLDGWTMSKGARLEHHIAISLGLEVLTDCDLQGAR